jgi:hypothetical protein
MAPKPHSYNGAVASNSDADVVYIPDFLPEAEATRLYDILIKEIPWQQFTGSFGKPRPRLESWHGDADAVYSSYNRGMQPHPWTPALLEIRRPFPQLFSLPV